MRKSSEYFLWHVLVPRLISVHGYGRYKTGVIAEGMYSAFVSFAQKMATSLSSLIIGVILSVSGFDYLTAAVVNNGFTDWSELSALGTEGYEKYVEEEHIQ